MKRLLLALVVTASVSVATVGCQRTVEVETGVRVECPYGHTDTSDVQTIEVPAKVASAYRVTTEKRVCDRHQRLEALYNEAQAALVAGDLNSAKAKLTQIAEDERTFRSTADQLAAIGRGEAPKPDTGGTPSTPTTKTPNPGGSDTNSPIGSLKSFVPDTLDGFTGRPVLTEPLSITREYDPPSGTKAVLLTVVAEQFRTAAEADRALNDHMARYPKSVSTRQDGSRVLRFGSDGRRFVSAAFTDGAVLVILELAADQGTDPVRLKDTVLDAAVALP